MEEILIWIIRGSQRKEMFLRLPNKSFLPNELRREINKEGMSLSLREISRHLKDFEKFGLANCLNKKDPYNKIYELTQKGNKIKEKLKKR